MILKLNQGFHQLDSARLESACYMTINNLSACWERQAMESVVKGAVWSSSFCEEQIKCCLFQYQLYLISGAMAKIMDPPHF